MSFSDEPLNLYTPKLVTKSMDQIRRRLLHSSNLSAQQRANKAGNEDFFAEDGKLYCRVCCKVVDHTRQGSLSRHKLSETHKKNKNKNFQQKTLAITSNVKLESAGLITNWVRASAAANILLFASNNETLRHFLNGERQNGDVIPKYNKNAESLLFLPR